MSVVEHAANRGADAAPSAPVRGSAESWLMRETRIGAHLYPLRAAGLAVVVGAGGAVLGVPLLLRVLGT